MSDSSHADENGHAKPHPQPPPPRRLLSRLKLRRDYRSALPPILSRFTGYTPPDSSSASSSTPIPGLSPLFNLPPPIPHYITSFIGAFTSILLIEAIMSTSTVFRSVYHSPMIVVSFGASAVLVFGAASQPFSQPRNLVLGHFFSALVGVAITRLFALDAGYAGKLGNKDGGGFGGAPFVNGALCMAVAMVVMMGTGTVHPPAGATALAAAVEPSMLPLSWRYLPTVLASSLIMLGWALMINNLGTGRYPTFWWAPGKIFVRETEDEKDGESS